MSSHPVPVFIDCDPGIDDCLALLYLAALHQAGEIVLLGVTTTAGNVEVAETARNAQWMLQLCGLDDVPVAPGLTGPAHVSLVTTPETHGPHGLGYLPAPAIAAPANAAAPTATHADHWRELWANAAAAGAHLFITGPLTNAAAAGIAGFSGVTVMGGAVNYRGNTTPTAEWNFWVDPHAAAEIFAGPACAGRDPRVSLPTLCSLEVTEQFLLDPDRLQQLITTLGAHPVAGVLPELLRFYFEFHAAQGEGYQAQIHDLLTCMVGLGKVQYQAVETTIAVEANSELLRGTAVADLRNHWSAPANARLVQQVDIAQAQQELLRAARLLAS